MNRSAAADPLAGPFFASGAAAPMTIASFNKVISAVGLVLLFASTAFADDVQAVPEPATLSLMAVGAAGMYFANRRRQKK